MGQSRVARQHPMGPEHDLRPEEPFGCICLECQKKATGVEVDRSLAEGPKDQPPEEHKNGEQPQALFRTAK